MSSYLQKPMVLGFAFSPSREDVAMIRKNRPSWQAGKLNGIGGKIEAGELPVAAMVREFFEETGYQTLPSDWQHYAVINGDLNTNPWKIYVFCAFEIPLIQLKSTTDEEIEIHGIEANIIRREAISNIPWLIAAALDPSRPRMMMDITYVSGRDSVA